MVNLILLKELYHGKRRNSISNWISQFMFPHDAFMCGLVTNGFSDKLREDPTHCTVVNDLLILPEGTDTRDAWLQEHDSAYLYWVSSPWRRDRGNMVTCVFRADSESKRIFRPGGELPLLRMDIYIKMVCPFHCGLIVPRSFFLPAKSSGQSSRLPVTVCLPMTIH